jgi:hypothetical protein
MKPVNVAMVLCVFGVLCVQSLASGALVNVAPAATYTYLTSWPGEPGIWGDSGRTLLNNNLTTDLVIESDNEPIIVLFDLGSDKTISQITVFATETPWGTNGLSGCNFYANTEADGNFSTSNYSSLFDASWGASASVDKSNTVWTVDTGVLSTPITARYIGIWATFAGPYPTPAISEVGIYTPEPMTLMLLVTGLVGGYVRRK